MMDRRRPWEPEEDEYIRRYYNDPDEPREAMMMNLDRTWSAIKNRASVLGCATGECVEKVDRCKRSKLALTDEELDRPLGETLIFVPVPFEPEIDGFVPEEELRARMADVQATWSPRDRAHREGREWRCERDGTEVSDTVVIPTMSSRIFEC